MITVVFSLSPENNYNRTELENIASIDDNSYDSVSSSPIRQSITSEEENIDSFDVNPKSGRWDVTETGTTDDQIVDGNLRLITTENTTSSSNEYFMDRGLQKTDAKIDYRYKALVDNSSQTEYGRDVLGDSIDFDESDREIFTSNFFSPTVSVANGLLTLLADSTNDGIHTGTIDDNILDPKIYNTVEIRHKTDSGSTLNFQVNTPTDGQARFTETLTSDGTWQTETITFTYSQFVNDQSWQFIIVNRASSGYPYTTEIDYIKFISDLDYATHAEGEVEDTWDFEDSSEFFFDSLGNVSDFNDGTTEDFTNAFGNEYNDQSEYLKLNGSTTTGVNAERAGLSISASTYSWITVEWYSTFEMDNVIVLDAGFNTVCLQSSTYTNDTWRLFSCDLSLDGDWTGTETELDIRFTHDTDNMSSSDYVLVNMVYLYDQELGDLDSWTQDGDSDILQYVNPEGYYHATFASAVTTSLSWVSTGVISIDTSIFDYITLRIKSNDANYFHIVESDSASSIYNPKLTSADTWEIFSVDLSDNALWDNTETSLRIYFRDEANGQVDSGDRWEIDYILLLASEGQSQDFTLGFWDQDNSQALANITHHLYNSSMFRWEIELYDSNQEIASYFYSSNYTVSDEYYRVSLDYNILESEFAIEIRAENDTQLFDKNWRSDFTTTNDNPALFNFEKTPEIYISTYTQFYGHQEVWIDYISTGFEEKEWQQINNPTDTDFLVDNPFFTRGQATLNDQSTYRLTIPSLDAMGGILELNLENSSTVPIGGIGESINITFTIYSVNNNDGALTEEISFLMSNNLPPLFGPSRQIQLITEAKNTLNYETSNKVSTENHAIDFSCSLLKERSNLGCEFNFKSVISVGGEYVSIYNSTINSTIDNSQEFVLEIDYRYNMTGSGTVNLKLSKFDFIARDIFSDIGNVLGGIAAVGIVGVILSFFSPLIAILVTSFMFLAEIWKVVGRGISDALIPVINALQPIITAIGTFLQPIIEALGPLITAVATVLEPFLDGLEGLLGDIDTAIGNLAAGFVAGFIAAFNTAVIELTNLGASLWNSLWTFIFDTIDGTGGLGDSIDNLWTLDIGTMISDGTSLVTFTMSLFPFVVIFAIFFIFSLPFLQSDGDVFKGTSGVFNNAFRGVSTPHVSLLGFGGKIVIPFIILVYIAMKLLIAAGTFPDVFGGLPI